MRTNSITMPYSSASIKMAKPAMPIKSISLNDSSFRANQTGSEAAFSFHHIGSGNTVYVFEAPIDMLSFITLYPQGWQQDSYVSLCSVGFSTALCSRNWKISRICKRSSFASTTMTPDAKRWNGIAVEAVRERLCRRVHPAPDT